jgi:hypothetical protein
MNGLYLNSDYLEPLGYYSCPCDATTLSNDPTYLMGPNGFDLTELELALVKANNGRLYRNTVPAQKDDWIGQDPNTRSGVVLNHSFLLYRRGYDGDAGRQLWDLAQDDPRIHRIAQQRPRWGLDISLEYIQADGTVFEIIHWEYDTDSWSDVEEKRQRYQDKFLLIDWEHGAQQLLKRKSEWHHLGWFPQSKYKCDYFGLIPENFGAILWQ